MTLSRAISLFGLLSVVGCSGSNEPSTAGSATAAASGASSTKPTVASASASASSSAAPSSSGKPASKEQKKPTKEQKKALVKHLAEGRKLAKKKDFKAALVELDAALAAVPNDPVVLAEAGWAAFGDKNLARAKEATTQALAHTSDAKLRAQALYTRGRANEEAGDKALAKRDYGDSLALRDNEEVKKRFVGVGGKPEEIISLWSTCNEGFATVADLCTCLQNKSGDLLFIPDAKITCAAGPKADLGDPRLSLVELHAEGMGFETAHYLVAQDDKKLRVVEQIGDEFEPGAFGVHNGFELKGAKTVAKGRIVAIHHIASHADSNIGGLELYTDDEESDTLCVLGSAGKPTVCPRTIPVILTSTYGPGVEPDPADLDAEMTEMLKNIKANESKKVTKVSWSVDDTGKLSVKVTEGDASVVSKALLEEVSLISGG